MVWYSVPSKYPTIAAAVAAARGGTDIIGVGSGYAGNETVSVPNKGLRFEFKGNTPGIVLTLAAGTYDIDEYGRASVRIVGNDLPNSISAGGGNNTIDGGGGNDFVYGGSGNDTIDGGAGDDYLNAYGGNDTIDSGVGDDIVWGGDGDDTVDGGAGNDVMNGGAGIDTVSYLSAAAGVTVSLAIVGSYFDGTAQNTVGAGTDKLNGFENLYGSAFDDRLTGDDGDNFKIAGWAGNDRIDGGAGNDGLYGGTGNDTLLGGAGDDNLHGEDGNDVVNGGAGNDLIYFSRGTDTLQGGDGDDEFYLDSPLSGLSGVVNGGSGVDTVRADDLGTLEFTRVETLLLPYFSTSGFDATLTQLASFGHIDDSSGVGGLNTQIGIELNGAGGTLDFSRRISDGDSISVAGGQLTSAVVLTGSAGDDVIQGSKYDDTLFGGKGADTLNGGAGADTLYGGAGADTLIGGTGDDVLIGGAGSDFLKGGGGNDRFVFDAALGPTNIDTVDDFRVGGDLLVLDHSIFTALTVGTLSSDAFWVGTGAHDANDRIIYNDVTGALFYDTNGSAAGGSVQFATLDPGRALTNTDFLVT